MTRSCRSSPELMGNSMVSLATPSITTMAITSMGGLERTRTANGNTYVGAMSQLVFPFTAYQTVGELSNFSLCKELSGATSDCRDATPRKPAFLHCSSSV